MTPWRFFYREVLSESKKNKGIKFSVHSAAERELLENLSFAGALMYTIIFQELFL
jgi:hypothetical protein